MHALTQIKGIGCYSAEVICAHPAFPVNSWSAKYFCWLFSLETQKDRASDALSKVKRYAQEKFGIFQRYVYEYLINDLENLSWSVRPNNESSCFS